MSDPLTAARLKLADATARMREAERVSSEANRERCSATNALNEAQREFDKTVDAVRKESAVYGTDWSAKR